MNLLKDRILVKKPAPVANVTDAGIILTSPSKSNHDCEVLLTGPACKAVKVGDVVRKYPNVSGVPYTYNGIDCLILKEDGEIEYINC